MARHTELMARHAELMARQTSLMARQAELMARETELMVQHAPGNTPKCTRPPYLYMSVALGSLLCHTHLINKSSELPVMTIYMGDPGDTSRYYMACDTIVT